MASRSAVSNASPLRSDRALDLAGSSAEFRGLHLTGGSYQGKDADSPLFAEISNDTAQYQALMLAGNRSDGTGPRKVRLFDDVYVHGNLEVNGSTSTSIMGARSAITLTPQPWTVGAFTTLATGSYATDGFIVVVLRANIAGTSCFVEGLVNSNLIGGASAALLAPAYNPRSSFSIPVPANNSWAVRIYPNAGTCEVFAYFVPLGA